MHNLKSRISTNKRFVYYLSICILLIFSILYSCTKERYSEKDVAQNEIDYEELMKIPEVLNGYTMEGIKIPDGTTTRMISHSEVELTFPEGILLVQIFPKNGTYISSAGKSYTCTCTGTGCDVINFSGNIGCSSCTEDCTGKWTGGNEQKLSNSESTPLMEEEIKFFLDLKDGIKQINSEELKTLSSLPSYLINLPEVEKAYDEFIAMNFKISNLDLRRVDKYPNEFGVIPVNFYGYAASLIVPVQFSKTPLTSYINSRGLGCDCSSGSSGCTAEKIKKGIVTVGFMCKAGGCTSCTMTNIE